APAETAQRKAVMGPRREVAHVADLLAGEARAPQGARPGAEDLLGPRMAPPEDAAQAAVDRRGRLAGDLLVEHGLDQRRERAAAPLRLPGAGAHAADDPGQNGVAASEVSHGPVPLGCVQTHEKD